MRIGVLASHGGTTLQRVIDATESGELEATVSFVISNNSSSGALERAARHGIASAHVSSKTTPDDAVRDLQMATMLAEQNIELLLCLGYMKKIGPATLAQYPRRTLNTHPSLLPAYGGHAFFGSRVHEAVINDGQKETGVTIHLVDAQYDQGPIVARKVISVSLNETALELEERVKSAEKKLLVDVLLCILDDATGLDQENPLLPQFER